MALDTSGLKDLQQKLDELNGKGFSSTDIYPDEFMSANTDFASWDDLCESYGVKDPQEDCATKEFSNFVREHSKFDSFEEMHQTAGAEWFKKQLQ